MKTFFEFLNEVRNCKSMPSFDEDQLFRHYNGQKEMARMLKVLANFCELHNIQYFASGGTLLGAVRHGGWIPHDADIDICMMEKDYDKFCNTFPIYHDSCFFQNSKTDPKWKSLLDLYNKYRDHSNKFLTKKNSPFRFSRLNSTNLEYINPNRINKEVESLDLYYGVRIDLFKWRLSESGNPNTDWVCNEWVKWIDREFQLNYEDIFPLKILKFEDLNLPVPNNYEKWLNASYGQDWRIPISEYPHEYQRDGKISDYKCIKTNTEHLYTVYSNLSKFALETLFKYRYTIFKVPNSMILILLGRNSKNELFIDSSHQSISDLDRHICTKIAA